MADTERLMNKAQGDDIISALATIAANILQVPSEKLIIDWSYTTLPASGNDHTIYAIPTGDADDPWDFYVWNDVDEEWVQFDWNFAVDSTLSTTSGNPVQNKVVTEALNGKVDAVTGKGLSTNDYTNEEKASVANSAEQLESTQTATGNPLTLTDAAPINAESLVVELEPIQEGSGDPSPTNVKPITGYTEVNVDDVGKNRLPITLASLKSANTVGTWTGNSYTRNTGVTFTVMTDSAGWVTGIDIDGTSTAQTDFILCPTSTLSLPIGNYKITWSDIVNSCYLVFGEGGTSYKNVFNSEIPYTFSVTEDTPIKYCMLRIANNKTANHVVFDPMICDASADTAYEPYHSSNATIQFGQTVYGAIINFRTGECKVNRAKIVLDGTQTPIVANWNEQANTIGWLFAYADTQNKTVPYNVTPNLLCDKYKTLSYNEIYNHDVAGIGVYSADNIGLIIRQSDKTLNTASLVTAYLSNNPIEVCYELAEPFTIQLTPQELKLLQGTNNITTNGTTITLGYQPDNVIGEVKGEIQKITEMPYLRILDNDVDTEIKNYRLYYRLISSSYTLVNLAEMLQHRFLFVEIIQNPSGTANHTLLHSALIDPRTIDGFEYQMKAGTGDTVIIESNIAENKFDLSVRYTGTHTSGDPTDYYVTIRMVD